MSNHFLNVPAALSTDEVQRDAGAVLNFKRHIQRYSTTRDSFVTLHREFDEFIMKDERTGSEHRLSADCTNYERLMAHWAQFASANAANI